MNKYYHRGQGKVVLPETHPFFKESIPQQRAEIIANLSVYAHCSPELPVGWFEGEEVYQVKSHTTSDWKDFGNNEFWHDWTPANRRIWIEPVADIAPYGYEKYFDTEFHEMRFRPIRKASIGLNDIFNRYNPFAKYEHFTKEQLLEEVKRLKEFEIAFKQIGDNP